MIIREFKITTTATATSLNERFNDQNNGYARAFKLFSLPSFAEQQCEMTNSALSEERELRRLIF